MDPNLLVQLFVHTDGDGEQGNICTAYPVAQDVIITAAHVLDDCHAEKIEARWWHLGDDERTWIGCEILWDGRVEDNKPDVALLHCKFPKSLEKKWGHLANLRPKANEVWAGQGFPFVGKRSGNYQPVPLSGKINPVGDRSRFFQLTVDAQAAIEAGWKGASGSPVVVGNLIIGVITNAPKGFNSSRFDAVPIFRLLQEETYKDFRKFVGYSVENDQREQLIDHAVNELRTWFNSLI